MITRFVKLTFREEEIENFKQIFKDSESVILSFGCRKVELLQDVHQPNVFFTHSIWDKEEDLNTYRSSDKFAEIWAKTKLLFSDKPQAWSLNKVD